MVVGERSGGDPLNSNKVFQPKGMDREVRVFVTAKVAFTGRVNVGLIGPLAGSKRLVHDVPDLFSVGTELGPEQRSRVYPSGRLP